MRKIPLLLLPLLLLGACGGGSEGKAVTACQQAIADRMPGRNHHLDLRDMRSSAKAEGDNVFLITSSIVFDQGLPNEYSQTFECRARVMNGQANVTFLQFQW
jgi:hypothetical protein